MLFVMMAQWVVVDENRAGRIPFVDSYAMGCTNSNWEDQHYREVRIVRASLLLAKVAHSLYMNTHPDMCLFYIDGSTAMRALTYFPHDSRILYIVLFRYRTSQPASL